eukprot:TRINITY_DN2994_c0_g2_i5.p2 TRINITY_DN2994_c0_g2~~TRINITY_DN2994_c0_g2_i5.p2  ORF type:complete len:356 (-),score=110.22 TRINITY_DN2994_c0_g2_i5:126-1193(-)
MTPFTPDMNNIGGQYLLSDHLTFHKKAIHNAKSNISFADSNKKSSSRGSNNVRNKRKTYEEIEHEKRLKLLNQRITQPKTMAERKKNIYDSKAYPVQIKHKNTFNQKRKNPPRSTSRRQMTSSSNEFYNTNHMAEEIKNEFNSQTNSPSNSICYEQAETDFGELNTGTHLKNALMSRIVKNSLFKDEQLIDLMDDAFKNSINVSVIGKKRAFLHIIKEYDLDFDLSRWFNSSVVNDNESDEMYKEKDDNSFGDSNDNSDNASFDEKTPTLTNFTELVNQVSQPKGTKNQVNRNEKISSENIQSDYESDNEEEVYEETTFSENSNGTKNDTSPYQYLPLDENNNSQFEETEHAEIS